MFRIITLLIIVMTAVSASALRIAHLTDPQLGFGPGGFDDDLLAFEAEVKRVNELSPDVVVVAGDMVNRPDSVSIAAFLQVASRLQAPVVYTPGNHDIFEPCTAEGLATYRNAFGPDFGVTDLGEYRLLSFNSLLLRGGPAQEMEAAREWLIKRFAEARADGAKLILLSHVPPFAQDIDEDDAYFNMPKAMRRPLLETATDAGTVLWLCGHTHRTHRNTFGAITILNPECTSCNFDKRPRGFRLLTIEPDGSFTWEFEEI